MTELDTTDARIESYIYKHIGKKSAREMATDLGVQPEQILAIKREMVDSVDELTISIQKAKLLRSLQELAEDAQEKSKNVADMRNYSGMINASVGAIKELFRQLNALSKQDNEKLTQLKDLRKREIFNMYVSTVDASVREIANDFEIPEDAMFEVFNRNLEAAAAEMDSR